MRRPVALRHSGLSRLAGLAGQTAGLSEAVTAASAPPTLTPSAIHLALALSGAPVLTLSRSTLARSRLASGAELLRTGRAGRYADHAGDNLCCARGGGGIGGRFVDVAGLRAHGSRLCIGGRFVE